VTLPIFESERGNGQRERERERDRVEQVW
jgi:hypothetical protein